MEKLSSLKYGNSIGGDIGSKHEEIISLLISSQMSNVSVLTNLIEGISSDL
jgi:hypothetical protein